MVSNGETVSCTFSIQGKNFLDAGLVSTQIKGILKDLGIDAALIRRVAIAAYEAEMNVVMYANEAILSLLVTPRAISIMVNDRGPGIPDLDLALREGYSTATHEMREMGFGAGMGLANIKKNADDFRITSTVGEGTILEIRISIN